MTTIANRKTSDSSHWYYPDSRPCYELPKKDGSGMKVPTLADARKLNLLPSVTTVLKCLRKQALEEWLIEQACLAVLTTPKNDGEDLDAFVYRVLHSERVQDQEAQAARDRGTEIHAALEAMLQGQPVEAELVPWVAPVYVALSKRGEVKAVEQVVVGQGYAGKVDLQLTQPDGLWLYDYKSCRKLPDAKKGAYWEHRCQLGAYALAIKNSENIRTCNVYISTEEPGKFLIAENDGWQSAARAFTHLVGYWQIANDYFPV